MGQRYGPLKRQLFERRAKQREDEKFAGVKFKLFFAWYDIWIGAYWSAKNRTLFLCLVPMVVLSVVFLRREVVSDFKQG